MTVTAIVVMNQDNKLTTTKNPLLRVKEVEELIGTYTQQCTVFVDSEQLDLRLSQCKAATGVYVISEDDTLNIPNQDVMHPKSAEMLIKHYSRNQCTNVALFLSPSQLDRVNGHFDQVVLVTINNPSQEEAVISTQFIDRLKSAVARKQLSMTTWSVKQSKEEHNRRYSVKIYA